MGHPAKGGMPHVLTVVENFQKFNNFILIITSPLFGEAWMRQKAERG